MATSEKGLGTDARRDLAERLQTFPAPTLIAMAQAGDQDGALVTVVKEEIAARGLDARGRWVGFDEARDAWGLV